MSTQTGFAGVNGASLRYEVSGDGPAMVMIHGHLLDLHQWDDQVAFFADSYRVVRYDARGFGDSTLPPEPFKHADDLRVLLDTLGIERAIVIGCSGGGATSIDFALHYPERLAALVLVGSAAAGFEPTGEVPPKILAFWEAEERGAMDEAVEYSLQGFTDGERRTPEQVNPAVRERTRQMTAKLYARPQVEGAEPEMFVQNAMERLGEIQAPTLVTIGGEDASILHELAEVFVARIPNARSVVIPDAGHHPNMEHPEQFNQIVREFLQENGL